MDRRRNLLLCSVLLCAALAGCAAFGGGEELTPADDAIAVETTVDDTDGAYYVPENDTVAIRMTTSGDRTEIPFDEYACRQARDHAVGVVRELIEERLDVDPSNYATSVGAEAVEVTYYDELGVSPTALETVTPERLVVSVNVFDEEATCIVPVSVSDGGSQPEPL